MTLQADTTISAESAECKNSYLEAIKRFGARRIARDHQHGAYDARLA
jgi:hypothetical protein